VYGRRVGERTLSFGHEGVLFRRSFVMYDRQTDSRWLHVTGRAIKGPLKGTQLPFLPSTVTTWGAWKTEHPETTVLLGRRARGHMGRFGLAGNLDRYGLSVGEGDEVLLVPFVRFRDGPVVSAGDGALPILAVFDASTLAARAFSRRVGDRTLTFEPAGPADAPDEASDRETGTTWDLLSGRATAGPLEGATLVRLPATTWLLERWRGFFPEGRVAE
jgi:hypothetical protein